VSRRKRSRREPGFTLIEVLAVVLMTGILMGVALDFYLDLSRASNRAADGTRETRRMAAVLDRMVRDLENTVFLHKPDAVDPLFHPWIFLGEAGAPPLGAERLKFVIRGHDPRRSAVPESDFAVVTYALRRGEEGGLELWRSETPGLPEGLDRSFPLPGSPGEVLFAQGIAAFGVSFRDSSLQLKTSWDSSLMVEESELPTTVEIQLAMVEPGQQLAPEELEIQHRSVRMPVRPLDLQAMFEASEEEEEEEDQANKTVCDCIDCAGLAASPSGRRLVEQIGSMPFAQGVKMLPTSIRKEVNPECL
jgi:prepilin-type N-terminal cleavage/methylation domain-containing protein